ncbi:MAG TPA: hypothetical protein VEV41_06065 [Terriglobales bacterium]|nr:hypothetical protein [Terriglobales bacterium]
MSLKKMFGKTTLCAMLGASLLAGAAIPAAHADRDDKCRRDIRKAEENLEKAIRKHGERSKRADQRRHQLEEIRERCHMRDRDHDRDHDRDRR